MRPWRYDPIDRGTSSSEAPPPFAAQQFGDSMVIDFDRLLAKHPGRDAAVFGTLVTYLRLDDAPAPIPIARGDVSQHDRRRRADPRVHPFPQ